MPRFHAVRMGLDEPGDGGGDCPSTGSATPLPATGKNCRTPERERDGGGDSAGGSDGHGLTPTTNPPPPLRGVLWATTAPSRNANGLIRRFWADALPANSL